MSFCDWHICWPQSLERFNQSLDNSNVLGESMSTCSLSYHTESPLSRGQLGNVRLLCRNLLGGTYVTASFSGESEVACYISAVERAMSPTATQDPGVSSDGIRLQSATNASISSSRPRTV